MSLLLETTLGNVTIDLDVAGSPHLCRNVLKLATARYYSQSLVYNVQPGRLCQFGDPRGDGSGGSSIYGLIDAARKGLADVRLSHRRFVRSDGARALTAREMTQKGRLVASEMGGLVDTIGSQLLLTVDGGAPNKALDGLVMAGPNNANASNGGGGAEGTPNRFLSVGMVVEDDDNVLDRINALYCDSHDGRPYADVRIIRCHVLDDPFDDPDGMEEALLARGVFLEDRKQAETQEQRLQNDSNGRAHALRLATSSPTWDVPPEEVVEKRLSADIALADDDGDNVDAEEREEALRRKEDQSRAVVLEMLGDLPSADIAAPENVLFVCKLNPITDDEDLELIFSRFDPQAKAEIIRDPESGDSLCYAFVEFTNKEQCNEAYFKMNNALVDDRRIKVDFSQSVAKVWNKYTQRSRGGGGGGGGGGRSQGTTAISSGDGMGRRLGGGAHNEARYKRWGAPPSAGNSHAKNRNQHHPVAANHHSSGTYRRDMNGINQGSSSYKRRENGRGKRRSRSWERDHPQGSRSRSPNGRRYRSRSRSRSRDRKRHKKDTRRDRHSSRGEKGDDHRHRHRHGSRKRESSKKKRRHHRSRSRSRSGERRKTSHRHRSRHSRSRS